MPYNILCIDGGGVRGVIPAIVLEKLQSQIPDYRRRLHLIAGTSTGGLIALAMAAGIEPKDITSIYKDHAKDIFTRSWWRAITSLNGLVKAKFDNEGLRTVLERIFPANLKLRDLRPEVLIPSVKLHGHEEKGGRWHPIFFHNSPGSPYLDELVIDVALRATAAPTYFPSYQGYIDGGVVVNDPSVAAIFHELGKGHMLHELNVVSLGTGYHPRQLMKSRLDCGLLQWARYLVPLMIDGTSQVVEYQGMSLKGRL
jgi:patatin-like phospholipase/acyl hydrolase